MPQRLPGDLAKARPGAARRPRGGLHRPAALSCLRLTCYRVLAPTQCLYWLCRFDRLLRAGKASLAQEAIAQTQMPSLIHGKVRKPVVIDRHRGAKPIPFPGFRFPAIKVNLVGHDQGHVERQPKPFGPTQGQNLSSSLDRVIIRTSTWQLASSFMTPRLEKGAPRFQGQFS